VRVRPVALSGAFRLGLSSASGLNGSAANSPPAFLSRISTLPSACSRCFWQSRESWTPSRTVSWLHPARGSHSQLSDNFFQARQRMLEIGLLRGSIFFAGVGFTVVISLYRWQRSRKSDAGLRERILMQAQNRNNRFMKTASFPCVGQLSTAVASLAAGAPTRTDRTEAQSQLGPRWLRLLEWGVGGTCDRAADCWDYSCCDRERILRGRGVFPGRRAGFRVSAN